MGATNFETYAFGRDMREAFISAVKDAQWEYGHGGYTGTIAEKPGAVLLKLPPRVTAIKFLRWVETLAFAGDLEWQKQELARLKKVRAKPGQGEAMRKRRAQMAKRIRENEREIKKIPAAHREMLKRAAAIYDDKWGDALALEITGAEAARLKAQHGLKGTRKRVFLFCGYASC